MPQQAQPLAIVDDAGRSMMEAWRRMLPNGSRLSDSELLAGVAYAKATGLDPVRGEFYLIPGRGVTPGYKGSLERATRTPHHYSFRLMTEVEREFHDLRPGDLGVICLFTDIELATEMRQRGLPFTPVEGVGVVRAGEKSSPAPTGRSWGWKCQQRALKDACNHAPGFDWMAREMDQDADEILAEGAEQIPGYLPPPATAKLDADQARAWVDRQRTSARLRTDPEYREQAIAEAHERGERNTLERKWDDMVMGDYACPFCGVRSAKASDHASDCKFLQLFPTVVNKAEPIEDGVFTEEPAAPPPPVASSVSEAEAGSASADEKILAEIKDRFLTYAQQSSAPSSEAQRKAAAAALSTLFGRDGSVVQAFLHWCYGKGQVQELTSSQASAIIKFVASTQQGGEWVPSAQAIEVAGAFRRVVLGQAALFE